MPFGLWTRVGQRDYVLGGSPDPASGKGSLRVVLPSPPPSKMNCNSESAENGHVNCIMSIPADSVWSQQYTGVVRLQVHICIYVKKQFE